MVNCISEILKIEPDIEHIYLANINHSKTLSLLKELVAMGGGIESLTDEQRKPLLSALERNGYNNQEIVLEGAAFYGVRASRV